MYTRENGAENQHQRCRAEPQPEAFLPLGKEGTKRGSPVTRFPLPPASVKELLLHGWSFSSLQNPCQ